MEKYFITEEEKKEIIEQYPTLECKNSIGVMIEDYMSIKCKILSGTCTYRLGQKNEYKNCKLLNK
ncbi:hypothetical protein NON08_01490 [Cetobacterium somerae]|uniref:hypothetical protein n=1 Tax=Cetobacterium sp. NK01 TaxID=2993530 RepID=UPI0021172803|nr:hypothetical protein [Cetobacterium sp. NK01]MCQ8211242.1 hypothetical protein [Cetobacterium sp. NK01]